MWWRAGHFNTNLFAEHSATARRLRATDCHPDAIHWIATTKSLLRRSFLRLPKHADNDAVGITRQEDFLMTIKAIHERRKLHREVQGISAALLPFEADGRVAVAA